MTDRQNNFFQCSLLAALGVIILLLGVIVIGVLYYNNGLDALKAKVVQVTPTNTSVPFKINTTPVPYYALPQNRTDRILFKSAWENDISLAMDQWRGCPRSRKNIFFFCFCKGQHPVLNAVNGRN